MKKLLLELTDLVWEVNQIKGYDAGITHYHTGGTNIYVEKEGDRNQRQDFRINFSDRLFSQKYFNEARDHLNAILTSNKNQ